MGSRCARKGSDEDPNRRDTKLDAGYEQRALTVIIPAKQMGPCGPICLAEREGFEPESLKGKKRRHKNEAAGQRVH